VPFIRQTRDKRGYEQTLVLHAYRPGQAGPQRTKILYLFRSPAGVRIGRSPLDSEVMEALEHTHPDLSFDWQALRKDMAALRPDVDQRRETYGRQDRAARAARRGSARPSARPSPAPAESKPAAVELQDESLPGRVLGAAQAARLRQRYQEVMQRIPRRARTPEERDRLTERARRLNPDEWPDEDAARAGAAAFDAECEAITGELPSRRRGRRGGRRRDARDDARPEGSQEGRSSELAGEPAGPSGIMAEGEEFNEEPAETRLDEPPRGADDRGNGRGLGPADTPDPGVPGHD